MTKSNGHAAESEQCGLLEGTNGETTAALFEELVDDARLSTKRDAAPSDDTTIAACSMLRSSNLRILLSHGTYVEVAGQAEDVLLRIRTAHAEQSLDITIAVGDGGPTVRLEHARALEVADIGSVQMNCERFAVDASDIALRSSRGIHFEAATEVTSIADDQRIEARRGNLSLRANDDLRLDGERIFLNSPTQAQSASDAPPDRRAGKTSDG
jgi:pyruvate kinase